MAWEIFYLLPYLMGAMIGVSIIISLLQFLYEKTISKEYRDRIKKKDQERAEKWQIQERKKQEKQNETQKKRVLDIFVDMPDKEFDDLFFYLASITEGESLDKFGLGILEVISIAGEAKSLRKKPSH